MKLQEVGGWYLPGKDSYFPRFVEGPPRKRNGFQREHLQKAFEHVRAWDVAIDVGAHCGFWTRDMATKFAKVYAFEPAEDCFVCLQKNTADLENVHLFRAGIGNTPGHCKVEDSQERPGNTGARYVREDEKGSVPLIMLDELGFLACDFLKVDVEGYELPALQGASKLIERYKPVIIMECDKRFSQKRYGIPDKAAEEWLINQGYRVAEHMRPDKVFVPL